MTKLSLATLTAKLLLFAVTSAALAQHTPGYNYDEAKIPPYTLLDPLKLANGHEVTTPPQWFTERRPEILRLFQENVFGRTPDAARHALMHARIIEHSDHALDGLAVREQVDLTFDPAPGITPPATAQRSMRLLLYVPAANAAARRPSPVVLGLNFTGNQSVLDDPAIQPTPLWTKPKGAPQPIHELPADSTRGSAIQQWQVKLLLQRGYALATIYYGDLEPDFKDMAQYSVRQLFQLPNATQHPDDWGAIGAWAWGLSRARDYLQLDPLIDRQHIAVTGHSRLGKAADWAAAQDLRFAALLSTESGHGGQSIQRRALGETVAHLAHSFPYWFAPAYQQWVGRDAEIPADGNLLLSLIAPRLLYVASAQGDEWSDPRGEFLSAVSASRVYHLLGLPALAPDTPMPAVDQPIGLDTDVAYHDRTGKHDVTLFDWQHYLDFLGTHWGKSLEKPAIPPIGLAPPPANCAPPPTNTPGATTTPGFPRLASETRVNNEPGAPSSPTASPSAKVGKAPHPSGTSTQPCKTPITTHQIDTWRKEIRHALYIPDPLPKSDTQTYSTSELIPGVTIEKISYVTAYGLRVPAVLYRPTHKPASRLPAIVVVNGHGADKTSWYSYYTGILYARAGAIVLTYDPIGEGERNDDHKDYTGEHDALIPSPASMPARLGGLMVTDAMQAVSTLAARPDVDPHRIAVMGFSMGSFIASLTGAADPRIHALLLVGGGDLDGPEGYWDQGHAIMCQAVPYKTLSFLGDRGAVLFTLSARRGDTFIINGTADTVVAIPTHGPEFFNDLRQRTVALNGSDKGVFTNFFDPGASHRPSWVTPRAATWLNNELHFPHWQGKDPNSLPTVRIGDWAARVGATFAKNYDRQDRDAGIIAIATDAPSFTAEQLDVLPRAEWDRRKAEFIYATWLQRASEATLRPTDATTPGR